ncbi:SusD/RagB family nutrient-binding outer membrane lipoprotein [Chitinophaga alhagiae]|uniref:SusD/RagB family nutrient-binding outer membrane lipoprotein n=1 Tax=Chitinophaga alhagiae TaxID=2203219 RepID=A0ABM6WAL6_9BACT|nr:SusD/RagB family nutrient-binding outer membrane lipoprotein [Chitinophaga alhagiae]AWO00866.1 SusD/RagB family nutrient-binding outer membrane lipoprotein [Chitinophaga alhagiae]
MKSATILMKAALCGFLALCSCTKKFGETNIDKNSIAQIGPAELPFLFSGAIASVPWGDQVAQNLFADQYAQYFACNVTYFPSDRLVIVMDWAQNHFDPIYTRVVPQLQAIFEATEENSAEHALAQVWWVYAFHRVTDYWGPIPYFKAGEPASSVPYDPQDKIYDDFFKRLDAAVAILKNHTGETPYGSYDIMYGGNVNKWIKFANTLRLRLALRISKADPARARTEAEAAYAAGVFAASPEDDAYVLKSNNDNNRLSVMSDWNEFRMSAAMESVMKGYNDPRLPEYFIPAVGSGTYEGLRNGLSNAQLAAPANQASANSHVGPRWSSPAAGGIASFLTTPWAVMTAAEAYFLRAEGALLGWSMGGTAKELYETGITNSMKQWGIADNAAIQQYINSAAVPVAPGDFLNSPALSNIPVKFHAASAAIQLEQIATQKWLCLFPDGVEAWAEYRRNHLPKLYPVANSDNPDISDPSTQWIRRMPFLLSEKISNGPEVEKAVGLLGGEDKITTPLWWDKN